MTMMTPDSLQTQYDSLLFAARRSVRYHRYRQRFLDRVHECGALFTAFAGTATFAVLLAELPAGWTWVRFLAAGLTAFASAAELVLAPARRARRHDSLAVNFIALEKDLVRAGSSLTSEGLVELQSRRLDIEAREPPVFRVLDVICHDELVTALGIDPTQRSNITGWQRLWRHFFDVGAHRLQKHAK